MRSGSLRRRITIQERSAGRDEVGQPVDTWTDVATVWAEVLDLDATELLRDGAFSAQITSKVAIRRRPGIKSGMRIEDGNRTLEIAAPPIDLDGRHRSLELLCREVEP